MALSRKPTYYQFFFTAIAVVLFLAAQTKAAAQPPRYTVPMYVAQYANQAVKQMLEYKIPASVILAQAILESRGGTSELAIRSNNHFGIKCHNQWTGDTIMQDDDLTNECFRKYENISESYADHSAFLLSRPRYSFLFNLPLNDYKAWCYGLKSAGYATAPNYAEDLIRVIEQNDLHILDVAEKLEPKQLRLVTEPELKHVLPFARHMLLWALLKSDHLFADAEDIFFPSLLLLGAPGPLETTPLAER